MDLVLKSQVWDDEYFELKFLSDNVKVYPCWVKRDWLPRADSVPEGKRMIFVTSNPSALNEECKQLIRDKGAELWSTKRFQEYLDFLTLLEKLLEIYLSILLKLLSITWLRLYNKLLRIAAQSRNKPVNEMFTSHFTQERAFRKPLLNVFSDFRRDMLSRLILKHRFFTYSQLNYLGD